MIRANRPLVSQMRTRNLLIAQLGAVALALATCMAGSARADDVGDLVVFQPQTPAVAADVNQNFDDVKTAVNSKSSDGIEFSSTDSSIQISDSSSTPTVVSTVTVTAPGPGFIKVDFSAYLTVGHTQDSGNSYAVCAIKTDTASPESSTGRLRGSRRFLPVLSGEISGSHYPHIATQGVHTVNAAGTVTLNVVCYRNTGSDSAAAFYRSLTATYHSDRL